MKSVLKKDQDKKDVRKKSKGKVKSKWVRKQISRLSYIEPHNHRDGKRVEKEQRRY